jgi:histone deacetylase HOS2
MLDRKGREKIVQEWRDDLDRDERTKQVSASCIAEAAENGIVRPKGYTVSWHWNPEVEKHHFGQSHPMKPWRLTLTKGIIMAYGMHGAMDTYLSRAATKEEMAEFHKDDYLDFLKK